MPAKRLPAPAYLGEECLKTRKVYIIIIDGLKIFKCIIEKGNA